MRKKDSTRKMKKKRVGGRKGSVTEKEGKMAIGSFLRMVKVPKRYECDEKKSTRDNTHRRN